MIVICPPAYSRITSVVTRPLGLPGTKTLWLLAALLLGRPAAALTWHSHSAAFSGPGWHADEIDVDLKAGGDQPALALHIGKLSLAGLPSPITNLRLTCPRLTRGASVWRCDALGLHAGALAGQSLSGHGSFRFRPPAALTLTLSRLTWGHSSLAVAAASDDRQRWHFTVKAERLALADLQRWLGTASGIAAGTIELTGRGANLEHADIDLHGQALTVNAGGGRYASDHLSAAIGGQWQSGGAFSGSLTLQRGQLYVDPLYWQLKSGVRPLSLKVAGRWRGHELHFSQLRLDQPGVVRARGSLSWRLGQAPALRLANIELEQAKLPAFYDIYLEPWLSAAGATNMSLSGQLGGRMQINDGVPTALDLRLDRVNLHGSGKRFGISGLNGRLALTPARTPRDSSLSWRKARFYRIALGSGKLDFSSHQGQLRLRHTSSLAVLDGKLTLTKFSLGGLEGKPWLRFGGRLQGLSLAALSKALDWPPLAGTLTGIIPEVRYHGQQVDVDGALLVNVFGGNVTIGNLKLLQPFGSRPQLDADVELYQLALQQLTKTFDFGRIEGKLSGYVRGLRLVDWQPVAFDAYLHTPVGDNSRHRISQRAVQALSSLGGSSAASVVSRGFLSLFKQFNYARLGIRCRLRHDVCDMGGVAPGPHRNDYYLVVGRGLPRLDVIGYNHKVDWSDLLARLAAAIHSRGPVIK